MRHRTTDRTTQLTANASTTARELAVDLLFLAILTAGILTLGLATTL